MHPSIVALWLAAPSALAFPWVAEAPGVDASMLRNAKRATHEKRPGAAPYTDEYPYTGAKNGLPGTGKGGIKVPADGDTAHAFEAPGPNDIRGPCPGLNTAANHHVC